MTAAQEHFQFKHRRFGRTFTAKESNMVTSPFLEPNGWIVDSWTIDEQAVAEGIPDNGFQPQSILLIGLVAENFYSLQWLNQNGQSCSVAGLQSDPPNVIATTLEGGPLIAYFGLNGVLCRVTLTLDSTDPERTTLTGVISMAGSGVPDTGSGTFTATANGGPGTVDTGAASRHIST